MEPQQEVQQQQANHQDYVGKNTSFLCRQSCTRWTPTTDQIRILKDLYYNSGVRSPTAEQIQTISAKLRQYGKIEGKNVFYWFQNHKARERQKKSFTADIPMHRPAAGAWKNDDYHIFPIYSKFPNDIPDNFPSSSASNSPSLLTVGSVGNYGYGSVAMGKSFQECSINPRANAGGQNFAWMEVDPYSSPYPNFLEKRKYTNQTLEMEEEEESAPEIETLPLFPIQGDVKQGTDYFNGWHHRADDDISAGSRASLELTLNSYAAGFPSS